MTSKHDQIMAIVRDNLDPSTAKLIELAMDDADRISIIRDAFLEGRDVEAVKMLRDLDPVGIRRVLPFNARTEVAGGLHAQVIARPQIPFTGNRLVVAKSCASYFMIDDISVRYRSMMPQAGSVDAELFSADVPIFDADLDSESFFAIKISEQAESRMGIAIDMPETSPGDEILITIHNIDQNPRSFRAALLGTTRRY
jgi:hypothetical protein